jgi:phage tail-like protein
VRLGPTKYEPLVLKHGVTGLDGLWTWYEKTIAGKAERKNASVFVLDRSGMIPVIWWDIINAVPVKWEGPSLNADTDTVAFESVTLVYEALSKSTASKVASALASAVGAAARVIG